MGPPADDLFAVAHKHHAAGRLRDAQALYETILQQRPDDPPALHYLGLVLHQLGHSERAVEMMRQAAQADPEVYEYQHNLGRVLRELGRLEEAAGCFERASRLRPEQPVPHSNLGLLRLAQGRLSDAANSFARALSFNPNHPVAIRGMGLALAGQQKLPEAEPFLRRAAEIDPNVLDVQLNLAAALLLRGNAQQALAHARRAIELDPNYADAQFVLGNALRASGQIDRAIEAYRRASALGFTDALVNCGSTLEDQGRIDQAMTCYREAIQRKPDHQSAHSNLCYAMHFDPDATPEQIVDEHLRWAERFAEPLADRIRPHDNDPSPHRLLRIGYVSPNLRRHVIGAFMPPMLKHHDRSQFHVTCYSDVARPDETSAKLRALSDDWRQTSGMPDEQLAELIRQDRIDILVDLTLHMSDHRLAVFARKPAPVQITHLAYCGTSGMRAMDWCVSDAHMAADCERFFTEKLLTLPRSYWCYQPMLEALAPAPPRRRENGPITFGCLNTFRKVNRRVIALWARLLVRAPGAKLLIHLPGGASGNPSVVSEIDQAGISPDQVELLPFQSVSDYLATYNRIDIALDPFPYCGGTTTLDALWMGVPVVSLAGQMPLARAGVSILTNVGLCELIAHTPDQYIQIAASLAGDPGRLHELRSNLRQRLQESPLMDGPGYASDLENAYRRAWNDWCDRR